MKLEITYSGIESSGALDAYAQKKLDHLDKLFVGKDVSAKLELSKTSAHHMKGEIFRAEANLNIDGLMLRAESVRDDLYASIDDVKDELHREYVKHKDKKE